MTPTETPPAETHLPVGITSAYPDLEIGSANSMRVTIDIPRADVQAIRIADMRKGATYFAIQHFVRCLANECRRQNWGINDSTKLAAFIYDRCRDSGAPTDGAGRSNPERLGTASVRVGSEGTPDVRPARQRKQTTESGSNQNK